MKWNEIVVEGVNFYCPTCDELLGKESELNANDSWHCGNCGWDKSDGGARHEDDPDRSRPHDRYQSPTKPAAPTPAPKPLPKSKQTLVKKSGKFEVRVYPGRESAGVYYDREGKTLPHSVNWDGFDAFGTVKKQADGSWSATRHGYYGRTNNIGSFDTLTKAANALKKSLETEIKAATAKRK